VRVQRLADEPGDVLWPWLQPHACTCCAAAHPARGATFPRKAKRRGCWMASRSTRKAGAISAPPRGGARDREPITSPRVFIRDSGPLVLGCVPPRGLNSTGVQRGVGALVDRVFCNCRSASGALIARRRPNVQSHCDTPTVFGARSIVRAGDVNFSNPS
jgi:hypothetical protein